MESVSKKIRKIRRAKNITLKELSEKTELSVSFLSQFERGISSITLVSLKKIAEALNITMKELFEDESDVQGQFVHKKDSGSGLLGLEKKDASYERLSGKFEGRKLESLLLRMEPLRADFEPCTHEGEEFIYILEGSARFTVDGQECIVSEGESIHYPSTLLHSIVNIEDRELVFLCIVTPTIF